MGNTSISRRIFFLPEANKQYQDLKHSKQTEYIKQLWKLIFDIDKNGNMVGLGSPERLYREEKYIGWYSRRIEINGEDTYNRLVYTSNEHQIIILKCSGHYDG